MSDERRQMRALRGQLRLAARDLRKAMNAVLRVTRQSMECGPLEDMIDVLSGDSTHETFLHEFGSMLLALSISCDRECDMLDGRDEVHGSEVPRHPQTREVPPDPA